MAKGNVVEYSAKQRARIIEHVLAEMSAGIPLSHVLGPGREKWLCSERCFWKWYHQADPDDQGGLVQKVARARSCGVEARIERALEIAETPMIGEIRIDKPVIFEGQVTGRTEEIRHEDMLGHRKLAVETAFKAAQMLKPKTYGPKLDLTSGGEKIALSAEIEAARRRVAGGKDDAAD